MSITAEHRAVNEPSRSFTITENSPRAFLCFVLVSLYCVCRQGIIGPGQEQELDSGLVAALLASVREMSRLAPPELQIWSYCWLALPMLSSLLL